MTNHTNRNAARAATAITLIVVALIGGLLVTCNLLVQAETAATTPTPTSIPQFTPSATAPSSTLAPIDSTTPAQTPDLTGIPQPSLPEFTIRFFDSSYEIPTTYSKDPKTGANVTNPGVHVTNKTIEITIKNQPLTSSKTADGYNIALYYGVRFKEHSAENWTNRDPPDSLPSQSNSEYTVLTFTSQSTIYLTDFYSEGETYYVGWLFTPGTQVDFQVNAMMGYITRVWEPVRLFPYVFFGKESGWNNTQTLKILPTLPQISVLSPQEKNCSTPEVPLTFDLDRPISQIKYSLDGQENITISGNTTFTGLSIGPHNVTVYAWDSLGNIGTSDTISFQVVPATTPSPTPSATPSPSPTQQQTSSEPADGNPEPDNQPWNDSSIFIIFGAVAAIVTVAAALVYLQKHHKRN